jgi:hypothetical protein
MNTCNEGNTTLAIQADQAECDEAAAQHEVFPAKAVTVGPCCDLSGQASNDTTHVEPAAPTEAVVDVLARRNPVIHEELEDWPLPFEMGSTAQDMASTIQKHCVMPSAETDAIVLWIIASYALEAFEIFPRLSLISPEMRCGKTTTMGVVAAMCRNGLPVANASAATLFRITQLDVTLLLDEADTFVKDGEASLIGIINSGHCKSTATVVRCSGDDHEPKAYRTWMPMVLASIGNLAATIMDRSIVINLRRKKSTEKTTRSPNDLKEKLLPVRRMIATWCRQVFKALGECPIEPPDISNDRAADNWRPLFIVAHSMGGHWPARCKDAYSAMNTKTEPTQRTQLLGSIKAFLEDRNCERATSSELVEWLCEEPDSPWRECNNGKGISPTMVASLLRPLSIQPTAMRWGENTYRGYHASDFQDAFERYL